MAPPLSTAQRNQRARMFCFMIFILFRFFFLYDYFRAMFLVYIIYICVFSVRIGAIV